VFGDGNPGQIMWDFSQCMDCRKVFGCSKHELKECEPCRNGVEGEQALGMYDVSFEKFNLCKDCAKICSRKIKDHGDEERNGTVCNFRCCSRCLNDHKCGDVPSDYI